MKPLLTCLLLIPFLSGCPHQPEGRPPCCRELRAGPPLPDRSLYHIDSRWTSDVGREVPLGVLRGRPQLVAMIYTSCEFACPIIVNDLRRITAALPADRRSSIGVLLLSIDPDRDTPERLAQFRNRMSLPIDTWTLLRGAADDVREVAALLGVNYRKDSRGQYAHSNLITLLDADGEVVFQQAGLNQGVEPILERINSLAAPCGTPAGR